MTEAEWLASGDPQDMLDSLESKPSARKLRLFGCACVRFVWASCGERPPLAVEVAEAFADGLTTRASLRRVRRDVRKDRHALEEVEARVRPMWVANWLAEVVASENAYDSVVNQMNQEDQTLILHANEWSALSDVLRDVVGNPFRTMTMESAWQTTNVLKLASNIYDNRRTDYLPVLADALEDAGCDNADILSHCRQPGDHVRGCWVVDLVLGKS